MARYAKLLTDTSASGLQTQVNAFLAGLTNPTIRFISVNYDDSQSATRGEYSIGIDYEDGGSALATPFLVSILEQRKIPDLQAAVQAVYTANPTYFFPGARYEFNRNGQAGKLPKNLAFVFYNATAGATANWVIR